MGLFYLPIYNVQVHLQAFSGNCDPLRVMAVFSPSSVCLPHACAGGEVRGKWGHAIRACGVVEKLPMTCVVCGRGNSFAPVFEPYSNFAGAGKLPLAHMRVFQQPHHPDSSELSQQKEDRAERGPLFAGAVRDRRPHAVGKARAARYIGAPPSPRLCSYGEGGFESISH